MIVNNTTRARFVCIPFLDNHVVLRDLNTGRSITNEAESIVKCLVDANPSVGRIFYKDTTGEWGELKHNGSEFIEFGFESPFNIFSATELESEEFNF